MHQKQKRKTSQSKILTKRPIGIRFLMLTFFKKGLFHRYALASNLMPQIHNMHNVLLETIHHTGKYQAACFQNFEDFLSPG